MNEKDLFTNLDNESIFQNNIETNEENDIIEEDIDEALIYSIGCSIKHVIKKGTLIHPDSVHALNYLIEHRRTKL